MLSFQRLNTIGRLGNQLFQIAFLTTFAEKHGVEYRLPPWQYARFFQHNFHIQKDLEALPFDYTAKERRAGYDKEFLLKKLPLIRSGHVRITNGYFQSYKYFTKKHARQIFQPKVRPKVDFDPGRAVAIHLRRGDFLRRAEYCQLKPKTYLRLLREYFPGFSVYVFTDDYPYCRAHFKGEQFFFPEGMPDIWHLQLMACFTHFILSNSTFCYWGPMLNPKPELVLYPKRMYTDPALCAVYNEDYWPKDPVYVGYDHPTR